VPKIGVSAALAFFVLVAVAAASFGGAESVLARFASLSDNDRIAVWQDTRRIMSDFAMTGTGLNTYGFAMLQYQTVRDGYQYIEAHNDYLQLAAEGGLLLGIPILLTVSPCAVSIRRRRRAHVLDPRGSCHRPLRNRCPGNS
jgi:O-antigen ligase